MKSLNLKKLKNAIECSMAYRTGYGETKCLHNFAKLMEEDKVN